MKTIGKNTLKSLISFRGNTTKITPYYSRLAMLLGLVLFWAASAHAGKAAPPAAPSNLSATPMSSSEIDLHWQDNALNEQGYKVQATTNTNGVWTQVAVLGAGATSFAHTGLGGGTTCYYRVCSYNRKGTSAFAGPVSATTPVDACSYSLSATSASFPASGGVAGLSVTTGAGCAWTVVNVPAWITITSGNGGTGSGNVSFSVAPNAGTAPLSCTLMIAGQNFTVTEDGAVCSYSLSAPGASFTSSGGNGSVNVTAGAGCGWTVANVPAWITITSGNGGSGNGTVAFSVAPNAGTCPLSATLTIAGKSFTVGEDGGACSYALSASTASFPAIGGNGTIGVTAGACCDWTAASSANWLMINSGATGTGNGSVGYSATANSATTSRSATLTIAGQTVSVTQDATACSYSISSGSASFTSSGGNGSVNVNTASGCPWTVANVPAWITIAAGGTGPATLNYTVAANTLTTSRSATLTIAGQAYMVIEAAVAGDTTPPSVSLTAPTSGSTVSGTITLSANASDNVGVTKVEFYCDSVTTPIGTATASPFSVSCNTTTMANGAHSFYAKAYDAANNSTMSASSSVTVSNAVSTGGQLQWVRTMASAMGYTAEGLSVAADSSGNVVVVGDYAGPMDLGSGPCPHNNIFDAFVAKYTAQGGLLWSKAFGGGARNYARAVAVDSQGNVIVAGDFSGTADFGGMILTAPDPYGVWAADMFVAKYSPSGSLLWVKSFGGASGDMGNAVAVDGSDNIILAGGLSSYGVNFGSGITLSGIDMVLVKLSPSGTTLWAKTWGGLGIAPKAVTVDRYGDVVVSGGCPGTMDLGGGPITADTSGANGVFVAKYSGVDGGYRWARGFGANGNDSGFGITTDPNTGNVVVTGGFMGSANFGGGSVTSAGEAMFLAGYDPAGNFLWVKTYGGMYAGYAMDQGNAVKIDANGNLVVTGLKGSPWNMGGSTVSGSGLFVASYSISGNLAPVSRWIKLPATGTTGGSLGNGVTIDRLGHVSATGSFNNGTVDFGGISATTPSGSTSGSVAQYAN
jgi:hypothetical protein